MRIFYAAPRTANSAVQDSQIWYRNLFLPLQDLGHQLIPFDYPLAEHYLRQDFTRRANQEFLNRERPRLEAELLRQVERTHADEPLDLFFSYFSTGLCRPGAIRAIRDLGIPTMNWFCNGSYQFYLVEELAPAYDFSLVPERFRLEDYRRAGAHPIYCQEAANPTFYRPYDLPRELDVTFVGARYADRPRMIGRLLDAGIDTRVWGPGWQQPPASPDPLPPPRRWEPVKRPVRSLLRFMGLRPPVAPTWEPDPELPEEHLGGVLSDEEMIQLFSRSRISLGFSSCGETHRGTDQILQVRLRDFEVPMSGGFYLVQRFEELAEFFEFEQEIATYGDAEELVDKARFYLDHPAERERIRQAGHRRARSEHTWQKRFQEAFREAGLS